MNNFFNGREKALAEIQTKVQNISPFRASLIAASAKLREPTERKKVYSGKFFDVYYESNTYILTKKGTKDEAINYFRDLTEAKQEADKKR